MIAALKDKPGGLSNLECEFRRNQTVGTAPYSIRTEIIAAHITPKHSTPRALSAPGENARLPLPSDLYAFGAKMASKNMMNLYREPAGQWTDNHLLTLIIASNALACSVLPADAEITLCGSWLGQIWGVGCRKGLFKPLLQRRFESAFLGLLAAFGPGTGADHRGLPDQPAPSLRPTATYLVPPICSFQWSKLVELWN